MKHIFQLIFLVILVSCAQDEAIVQFENLNDHNMKIIPQNPTSQDDIKLVVYDECTYNVLSGVSRNGKNIDITKTFNSMMKWPCFPEDDTISIGKLPVGDYTVNYKLLDKADNITDPVFLSFSFRLGVIR